MTNARTLIEGVLAAEASSFNSFYDLTFPYLYAFAVRESASRAEAERLCGEIFEEVLGALREAQSAGSFERWLLAKAKDVARQSTTRQSPEQGFRARESSVVVQTATK